MGQRGGEQTRGIERLHQVMADGSQESTLGLTGPLGLGLRLQQCLVELGQLAGALVHPPLQALVRFLQRPLGFAEGGDVGEAHDEAATGHRVADDLDDAAVREHAFGAMRRTLLHPGDALVDVQLRVTGPAQPAPGIVQNDVGNRTTDGNQPFRILEHFQITAIPGHQPQGFINHADPLTDVLDRALQQAPVELQHLGGFINDAHHIVKLHVAPFNRCLHHQPRRRSAQYAGQQALGQGNPAGVCSLAAMQAATLALGIMIEGRLGALLPNKTRGQLQQVVDPHPQQHLAGPVNPGLAVLADKAAGLPVFQHTRPAEQRAGNEDQEVAYQ